ncbi:MAG: hypothetical protein ACE37F_06095 [Nannocystaceae bacterium]|nr:hypothetical protein [bacterium]
MLIRIGFAKPGRITTVPSVAVAVALLGATGLLVGAAAAVMIVVRGTQLQAADVPPMVGLFGFFGVSSLVMAIAGGLAVRSGRLDVWREADELRWRRADGQGAMPRAGAGVVVRTQGFGKYRQYAVELVGPGAEHGLALGGSVLETVAKARRSRYARALGLA